MKLRSASQQERTVSLTPQQIYEFEQNGFLVRIPIRTKATTFVFAE